MGYRILIVPQPGDRVFRPTVLPVLGGQTCQIQRVQGYLPDFELWSIVADYTMNANGFGTYVRWCPGGWEEMPAPSA